MRKSDRDEQEQDRARYETPAPSSVVRWARPGCYTLIREFVDNSGISAIGK